MYWPIVNFSFKVWLREEGEGVFIGLCPYFQVKGHNVTDYGYIKLPDCISELNDYMCGPMNRKGLLCKECIDHFGPSLTSVGYHCSNCTDAWYGVPLYLFLEFVPITLFYLAILTFRICLTCAVLFWIGYSYAWWAIPCSWYVLESCRHHATYHIC